MFAGSTENSSVRAVPLCLFQNAHAYVNAAFKMKVTEDGKQILGRPAFVFGGIDDKLVNIMSY